jgi:hypothetical protein
MARIRTIKPEFFSSEDIFDMTPLARLFYVSLWCESDREGRFEWKLGTLKARYLPADNCDINALAQELISKGLIIVYEVDGKKYAEIPTFTEHQVINNRESDSKIPSRVVHASSTRQARVKAEGKEGKEGNGASGTPADIPFDPMEELKARGVNQQTATDWMRFRRDRKAKVTPTVLRDIIAQADIASLSLERALTISCRRGWTGFEAAWIKPEDRAAAEPPKKDWT